MFVGGKRGTSWYAGALLLLIPAFVFALQDGAARTPPMGFNTWNFFGCNNISETNVFNVAKSLLQVHPANWEGKQICLKDVGYQYINLDDCWHATRAADGTPQWNTSRFQHGFPWLVDTIHNMGLKIGIYSDCGTKTCAGYFGTWGYDSTDACTYRKWGFDYLKFDWCNVPSAANTQHGCDSLYHSMGQWLVKADSLAYLNDTTPNKQHHRLIFSMCQWDYNFGSNYIHVWQYGDSCGHLWRTTGDISAKWSSMYSNWNTNLSAAAYAGPGGWNDPDMLEIGNSGLSDIQNQSHMDLWCIAAAPLLMGNNTAVMTEATFTALSNREVIAIDQDSLGYQGRRVRTNGTGGAVGNLQVITKALKVRNPDTVNNRKWAAVILNNSSSAAPFSIRWTDIGETNNLAGYRVRNLWLHRWIKSKDITDTTSTDTMTTMTDSVFASSIPGDGTIHVLLVKGDPDYVPSAVKDRVRLQIPAQLEFRMRNSTHEVYVPIGHSTIEVFNAQGQRIASIPVSQLGWYQLPKTNCHGACLVRLKTPAGSVSRVMAFSR